MSSVAANTNPVKHAPLKSLDPTRTPIGILLLVLRVVLGGLFVFAAVLKLRDPQAFVESVMAFKILPEHLATLTAFALPWAEAMCGVLLILGLWARAAALLLVVMVAVFVAGIVSAMYRGLELSCGCFGKFEIPCKNPVGVCHIVRNSVLLVMALVILMSGPGSLAIDRYKKNA